VAFLRGWDPAEIDIIRTDGSDRRRILKATQQLTGLAWSPDGRYLLYTAAAGGVWRVPVAGASLKGWSRRTTT
jgi:Tol biopolymer transport system component